MSWRLTLILSVLVLATGELATRHLRTSEQQLNDELRTIARESLIGGIQWSGNEVAEKSSSVGEPDEFITRWLALNHDGDLTALAGLEASLKRFDLNFLKSLVSNLVVESGDHLCPLRNATILALSLKDKPYAMSVLVDSPRSWRNNRQQLFIAILGTWMQEDAEQAMDWYTHHREQLEPIGTDEMSGQDVLARALGIYARTNLAHALQLFSDTQQENLSQAGMRMIEGIAIDQPGYLAQRVLAEFIGNQKDMAVRMNLLDQIQKTLEEVSGKESSQAFMDLSVESDHSVSEVVLLTKLQAFVNDSDRRQAASELLESVPEEHKTEGIVFITENWLDQDVPSTIDWLSGLEVSSGRDQAFAVVAGKLAKSDHQGALDAAQEISDEILRADILELLHSSNQ